MLLVGAGKARIDLDGVLPFDGFGTVRDALHIRTVIFENGDGTRACLLSVDATSLRDDAAIRQVAAEAAGCAPEGVWVAVTHTFSSPHVRTPEHLASDAERARNVLLGERLVHATRAACQQAAATLAPARLEIAKGPCSINVNRDVETDEGWWIGADPTGFSDRTVRVLRAVASDTGGTIVTLFTADVQPSMLQGLRGEDGYAVVSADVVGETAAILERHLGGIAIFLVGAAGDQAPRVRGAGALPTLALALAGEVEVALEGATPLAAEALALSSLNVTCPAQRRADFATLAPTRSYEFVEEGTVETRVSVARLGSLVVAGVAPEVDSAFGHRLRTTCPSPFELVTMVNGAQKYLPSSEAYDRITYEAMNSSFARGSDEVLATAIFDLVRRQR